MTQLLFVNAKQVATCAGPGRARHGIEMSSASVLTDTAVATDGENIVAVGPSELLMQKYRDAEQVDCAGRVLTPGLVDSHTHAIFGRARYEEQEMRAAGVGYMDIARRGGGIHSSVADLRSRSEDELFALALPRIMRLASYGSTTIEVKSGYGLSLDDELKSLRVIERLSREVPVRLVPTWLGAHEIPREFREKDGQRRDYIRHLIADMLPQVVGSKLAMFADVFCEPGVFTVAESREILTASRRAGLSLKLHADELEPHGGAELAADLGATSADHLGAISDAGIAALARSSTVATLLPGTMVFLGKDKHAPARSLIDAGAAVSLATDFNPGTSPTFNFPLILTLGVSQLRMSVAEAIIASTVNGAAALGLATRTGQLAPGYSADLAVWEAEDLREIPYWYGDRRCMGTWARGKGCHALRPSDNLNDTRRPNSTTRG
jgi:imidazolonepropionase